MAAGLRCPGMRGAVPTSGECLGAVPRSARTCASCCWGITPELFFVPYQESRCTSHINTAYMPVLLVVASNYVLPDS